MKDYQELGVKDKKSNRQKEINHEHTISNHGIGTEECLGKWDLYGPDAEVPR